MHQINLENLEKIQALSEACGSQQLVIQQGNNCLLRHVVDESPVDVFAVQKSVLSLLLGIAEDKYLLETCDAINHHLEPEWTELSPWHEASLTIETLLTMTTGMDDELGPLGTVGEQWRYNNTSYQYLKQIPCLHTGLDLQALSLEWLFEPLAMGQSKWIDRSQTLADGTPFSGLETTADDLVKLGSMVLNRGQTQIGEGSVTKLIPEYYIDLMSEPGSADNPAWGLCWWNNNQAQYINPKFNNSLEMKVHQGPIIPAAPSDLIAARGLYENYLYIVPSLDLVVARTCAAPESTDIKRPRFEQAFWQLLLSTRVHN